MFKRFGQIFWGLLLVILDFQVQHVDVLPDFIGYLLVAAGCGGLTGISRRFATARSLNWVLAVIALLDYAPLDGEILAVYSLVHLALNCTMMWYLLGGVMEFAAARQRLDLSARAANRRILYIVLMSTATLLGLAARNSRDFEIVALGFSICAVILIMLILSLLYQVRHELAADNVA